MAINVYKNERIKLSNEKVLEIVRKANPDMIDKPFEIDGIKYVVRQDDMYDLTLDLVGDDYMMLWYTRIGKLED